MGNVICLVIKVDNDACIHQAQARCGLAAVCSWLQPLAYLQ